ncbi:hypothetical protein Vretifemale_20562, partial [Volvox reticuliferus]
MTSLFGNLFGKSGGPTNLFSNSNKFKAPEQPASHILGNHINEELDAENENPTRKRKKQKADPTTAAGEGVGSAERRVDTPEVDRSGRVSKQAVAIDGKRRLKESKRGSRRVDDEGGACGADNTAEGDGGGAAMSKTGKKKDKKRVAAGLAADVGLVSGGAPVEDNRPGKKRKASGSAAADANMAALATESAKTSVNAAAAAARASRALQQSLDGVEREPLGEPTAVAADRKAVKKVRNGAAVTTGGAAAADSGPGPQRRKDSVSCATKRRAPEPRRTTVDEDEEDQDDNDDNDDNAGGSGSDSEDGGISNSSDGSGPRDEDHNDDDDVEGEGEDGDEGNEDSDTPRAEVQAGHGDPSGADGDVSAKRRRLSPEEEAARLARTIFVGNLPSSFASAPKLLRRLFSGFGAIESVRIRAVPIKMDAKMPRRAAILSGKIDVERGPCTAYVVFGQPESARAALGANMQEVEGHHIRVDLAAPKSAAAAAAAAAAAVHGSGKAKAKAAAAAAAAAAASRSAGVYDPSRSVFVGNLHFQTTDEELIELMLGQAATQPELADAVEAVRVVRDRTNHVGKGFAFILFKTKAAARAALSLDGQVLRKRPLRITRASRQAAAAGATAGGGRGSGRGRGRSAAMASDPSSWQGLKTKGKVKAARGPKPAEGGRGGMGTRTAAPGRAPQNRQRSEKRPAVAARKAAAAAAIGTGRRLDGTGIQKKKAVIKGAVASGGGEGANGASATKGW